MRDRRFVAVHRGGPLDATHHRLLATWAADCADRAVSSCESFAASSELDPRPRRAIEVARAWGRGDVLAGVAMKAAVAAHAAARAMSQATATAAARAAGHAAATAHAADHCLGAATYAQKAVRASGGDVEAERAWQIEQLPAELRGLVTSALARRHAL